MSENLFNKKELNIDDIKLLLPHRYPMLLVDKVRDIIPEKSATGIKCVTINEPFFHGHFPTKPIMPGVMIIEAMAQTAGILVLSNLKTICNKAQVYFMSVENAKFRKPVVPGDVLEMRVEKIRHKSNVWKFSGKAYVDNELHTEAIFMAMINENK